MTTKVLLYVGAAGANPGKAGYGVVLTYPLANKRKEIAGGFADTILNRIGIMAIIIGLETLKRPCQVTVYCPLNWVVGEIVNGAFARYAQNDWRKPDGRLVEKHDLWQRLYVAMASHQVTAEWRSRKPTALDVEEHVARELARAAELARDAMHAPNLPPDIGYQRRSSSEE